MLLELLPFVKRLFTEKWGKRNYYAICEGNCSSTIVLDGHQKATKRVCAIKNISVPSYDGAIRDVKVGCSATPVFKSKNYREHLLSNDNRSSEPELSNVRLPRTRRNVRNQMELGSFQFNLRCKTLKSSQYKRILRRTSGIIAAAYNCGFICSLSELFGCESISQVYNFLLYMSQHIEKFPDIIIYDGACHLKLFIENSNNFVQTLMQKKSLKKRKFFVINYIIEII
ncbi:unnamed protein product [Rotaria magnacalcarata]|nr:unnamed protein product [Rotaria magnacalcarata]CAF2075528.1 unnamed protein product [Rotaria magnacalcarata]